MKEKLSRRDFLKLLGISGVSGGVMFEQMRRSGLSQSLSPDVPNVLVLVYDAFSAKNISLYGYSRETTPNLAKFAQRATVYHQHYSNGIYTTPGTASLLTGTYPWTHGALNLSSSPLEKVRDRSIFSLVPQGVKTFAYTHNPLAALHLHHFSENIDISPLIKEGGINEQQLTEFIFPNDFKVASAAEAVARGQNTVIKSQYYLATVLDLIQEIFYQQNIKDYLEDFSAYGLPHNHQGLSFTLEHTHAWLQNEINRLGDPFLAYVHLYPPHSPYHPPDDFVGLFRDGQKFIEKPVHPFSTGETRDEIDGYRIKYDEFVAYTDYAFGQLVEEMEALGLLDNTYLIVTSDHGEIFERGLFEHLQPVVYEPLIHIPLMIRAPKQRVREDVFTPTSAVDVLPTIAQIYNQPVHDLTEGQILTGFGGAKDDPLRPVFVLEARESNRWGPISKGIVAMIKEGYKLSYYFGYEKMADSFELYHLGNDPEEMENLAEKEVVVLERMKEEMLGKLNQGR